MRERLLEHLPAWSVPNQAVLVALGFIFATGAAILLARRDQLPLREVALGLLAAFVGAIVGSRLLANLVNTGLWLDAPWRLLDLRRPGSSSLGALAGGCLGFWLYARRTMRLDPWRAADAIAPAAGLGLAFARLGCLAHGCDFGRVTGLAWGVRFPQGSPPFVAQLEHGFVGPYQALSLPVHPFQLVLAGVDLALFAVFATRPALGRSDTLGSRALWLAASYFAARFVVEFLRSPWTSPTIGVLLLTQWICLAALVASVALVRWRSANGAAAPGD